MPLGAASSLRHVGAQQSRVVLLGHKVQESKSQTMFSDTSRKECE